MTKVVAAGRVSPLLRRMLLAAYIVFLLALILTVLPLSALLKQLLKPLLRPWLEKQKYAYSLPSGE